MTANAESENIEKPNENAGLNSMSANASLKSSSSATSTFSQSTTDSSCSSSSILCASNETNGENIFEIAAKAEKLLKEILSSNKSNNNLLQFQSLVKQEPVVQQQQQQQPQQQPVIQAQQIQPQNAHYYPNMVNNGGPYYQQQIGLTLPNGYAALPVTNGTQYIFPPSRPQQVSQLDPNFYIKTPPPIVQPRPFYYQIQQPPTYYQVYTPYHHQQQQQFPPQPNNPYIPQQQQQQQQFAYQNNPFYRKRKFGEINNYNNFNRFNKGSSVVSNNNVSYQQQQQQSQKQTQNSGENLSENGADGSSSHNNNNNNNNNQNDEEDLNLMRERELKDLKCKSVVEKMSVFLRYYQQFKESYIERVQSIECSDSLKIQFHSLVKYLNEYEGLLAELDMMITEHERDHCKNNHRKTKKFFNKTKAFIRYECNKRLQSNIFEYRRLINSQDRYAGMYDLLDMNSYLISLLPDIGVSIRRYINKCEKAKELDELEADEYQTQWHSENSNDSSTNNEAHINDDISIPSFKEFVASQAGRNDEENDENSENKKRRDNEEETCERSASNNRSYESFSKGIDSLNRYLLKRVEDEESLDELVKERIIKWINKRQAKYILIFSDVDKLLNQHKAGECYAKFHSYLLFNLGKLVTVCDSYHQKLKELLYSTTIRRKKKRKKVKLLPEAMTDVFDEISELKRALDCAKVGIKRCNEHKANPQNSTAKETKNF